MTKKIKVKELLHEGIVTGRHSGRLLREEVYSKLGESNSIDVDFSGITMLTQSAADEFIGRLVRQNDFALENLTFLHCEPDIKYMLEWAVANAFSVFEKHTV